MTPQLHMMRITLFLLLLAAPALAQGRVSYEIAFANAAHHEAEVSATFAGVPAGKPLEVRMARTSPGRYALHEFAKNVYSVKAFDGRGQALTVTQPNLHQSSGTSPVTMARYGSPTRCSETGRMERTRESTTPTPT